jgi:hypothetical protein
MSEANELAVLLGPIFDNLVDEWECHGFARDVNDLPAQFAFEFAMRACARLSAWSKDSPSTDGHYWYLCSDGDTGLIEIVKSDTIFYNGETTESVAEMTEAWGITHWCGPLQHPPIPTP